jgi:hypothetical protein
MSSFKYQFSIISLLTSVISDIRKDNFIAVEHSCSTKFFPHLIFNTVLRWGKLSFAWEGALSRLMLPKCPWAHSLRQVLVQSRGTPSSSSECQGKDQPKISMISNRHKTLLIILDLDPGLE